MEERVEEEMLTEAEAMVAEAMEDVDEENLNSNSASRRSDRLPRTVYCSTSS